MMSQLELDTPYSLRPCTLSGCGSLASLPIVKKKNSLMRLRDTLIQGAKQKVEGAVD